MARLLFPSDEAWYDEMRLISSYYESELENTILSHVETVFPDYVAIKYKRDIRVAGGSQSKAPDLALINKDYGDWWIVEVELGSHSLQHVNSQIDVFINGEYNPFEVAKYIKKQDVNNVLDLDHLREMVSTEQPKVLVIVDEHDERWKSELEGLGAFVCIFQVFKSKIGHRAFRLDGSYPFIFENLSHCRFLKSPPNMMEVLNADWLLNGLGKTPQRKKNLWDQIRNVFCKKPLPSSYEDLREREIEVDFLGKISRWKIIVVNGKTILKAIGVNKVDVNSTYVLGADRNFKLYLKPN